MHICGVWQFLSTPFQCICQRMGLSLIRGGRFVRKRIQTIEPTLAQHTACLAQLAAPTQMHVQSCTVEVQLHSPADSLTQASIRPRSVK